MHRLDEASFPAPLLLLKRHLPSVFAACTPLAMFSSKVSPLSGAFKEMHDMLYLKAVSPAGELF